MKEERKDIERARECEGKFVSDGAKGSECEEEREGERIYMIEKEGRREGENVRGRRE